MHTIRSFRLAALGAALLLGGATVATAQPPARPRAARVQGARPGARHGKTQGRQAIRRALFRGIDLSVAQRRQLRDISIRYGDQRQDLVASLRGKAGITRGQRPDSATRARLRGDLQTQNRALMDRHLADVRAVLTAEQRTTFDANVARFRERVQARDARRPSRRG